MGNYAYELKEATTFIHKDNFSKVLEKIKEEVKKDNWRGYGWRNSVLNANSFEDVLDEFNIQLVNEGNGYHRPFIDCVYVSHFFSNLIEIIAPYMTDGVIEVDDEYNDVIITFENRKVRVVRR